MKHLLIALKEYATTEVAGSGNNPEVVKYAQDNPAFSWVTTDETAWCAIFLNWCLMQAGVKGTGKANARSFLDWGAPVTSPELGDIVVFWRGKPDGWQGHVAIYINEDDSKIYCLGGNQSDKVNIAGYSKSQLLGYRRAPESSKMMNINPERLTDAEAITLLLLGIKHFKKN